MKGEQYTAQMDTYSFGVILNELMSLIPPFSEYDEQYMGKPREVFKKAVVEGLRPKIPEYELKKNQTHETLISNFIFIFINSDCPKAVAELITTCWKELPQERPSFEKIVVRLVEIINNLGYSVTAEDELEQTEESENDGPPKLSGKVSAHSSMSMEKQTFVKFDYHLEPKHTHSVQALLKVDKHIWSGCRDGFISVWDEVSFTILKNKVKIY